MEVQCLDCGKIVKVKNFVLSKGKHYKCGKCNQFKNPVANKEIDDEYVGIKHKYNFHTRYGIDYTKQREHGVN